MIHITVLNPEGMHLFEQPNARSKIFGVHRENLFTTPWNIVSDGYKNNTYIANHSRTCEKGAYGSHDNLSHSGKSAHMKRNWSQYKHEHVR